MQCDYVVECTGFRVHNQTAGKGSESQGWKTGRRTFFRVRDDCVLLFP